jgi:hypothetical protein
MGGIPQDSAMDLEQTRVLGEGRGVECYIEEINQEVRRGF